MISEKDLNEKSLAIVIIIYFFFFSTTNWTDLQNVFSEFFPIVVLGLCDQYRTY